VIVRLTPEETLTQSFVPPSLTAANRGRKPCKRVLQCDEQLATSPLLFLAQFLKSGIAAQRVPDPINVFSWKKNIRSIIHKPWIQAPQPARI